MPFYFAAGEIPAAEKLGHYDSFDPTLTATTTNPNLGADGFALGDYFVSGFVVTVFARIFISGTGFSVGSGAYEIAMPFPGNASLGSIIGTATPVGSGTAIGSGILRPTSSAANIRQIQLYFVTASGGRVRLMIDGGVTGAYTSTSTPTPGEGMRITFNATYPADPASLP